VFPEGAGLLPGDPAYDRFLSVADVVSELDVRDAAVAGVLAYPAHRNTQQFGDIGGSEEAVTPHRRCRLAYIPDRASPHVRVSPVREDTVRSAAILREARLRAGLSQDELAKVSRKDRTVIARYEQGVVAPSLDTLVQLLRACGFDIPLELVPYDAGPDERIEEIQMLAPERRLDRMLEQRRLRFEEAHRRREGR
jgi:transcriptional regulator with XRE-family HTH domain